MRLSERLRKGLEAKNLSQSEFASVIGVNRATVSLWLNDNVQKLDVDNLLKAAKFLGVSPMWLSSGVGSMRPKGGSEFALYEDRLSARGLKIMGRLLELESASRATNHFYALIENALALADVQQMPIPANDNSDLAALCERLPEHQREALAAFLSSLTE